MSNQNFAEQLKNDPQFEHNVRKEVEILKMSPEQLLNLSEEQVNGLSLDEISIVMDKIVKANKHLKPDGGWNPDYVKFLERAQKLSY